jgi:FkbM family methyltransferase
MTEDVRYLYDLTPDSVVLDVGAYFGNFAKAIFERYHCHILAFEPVEQYIANLRGFDPKIRCLGYGLGAKSAVVPIAVRNDSSTLYFGAGESTQEVVIRNVVDVFRDLNLDYVDLMKINIEGAEYDLLDLMLDTRLVDRVKHFQIQFHSYGPDELVYCPVGDLSGRTPDSLRTRRDRIRARLAETHDEQWCSLFVWEGWAQKLYNGVTDDPNTYMPDVWEHLVAKYNVKSVLDVGCGTGNNLRWFHDHGCDVMGVDGEPRLIQRSKLPQANVRLHDYRVGPLMFDQQFDLCWSSEFVEHVHERFVPNFLASFRSCKYVCLTHATPGQGGYLHFNEQPTEYWVEKMGAIGYRHVEEETKYLRSTGPETLYGRRTLTFFERI